MCKIRVIRCVSKEKVFYKCPNNFQMRVVMCIITAFVVVDSICLLVLMSQKDNTWTPTSRPFGRRTRG